MININPKKLIHGNSPFLKFPFKMEVRKLGILVSVLVALNLTETCFALDFQEDFSTYQEGSIDGQQGWKKTTELAPIIGKDEATGALFIGGNPEGGTWCYLENEIGHLTADAKITILLRCRIGTTAERNEVSLGIGSARGTPAHINVLGLPNGQVSLGLRLPDWGAGSNGYLSNGQRAILYSGEVYEIRSVWDLADADASLEYRNVSSGEEEFTTVYSDKSGASARFPLGEVGNLESWNKVFLRLGADSQDRMLGFSISTINSPD